MIFRRYDPGLVAVSFRGIQLLGFADGTFVSSERAEDAFSTVAGSAGDVTRVRSRNRIGTVTVTLMAESPTNDLLSAVAAEDELFGTGVGELLVKDLNGTTIIQAENAWIKKLPTAEYAAEASSREWMFDCDALEMALGGSLL